jgi:FG-GAP-like repeat
METPDIASRQIATEQSPPDVTIDPPKASISITPTFWQPLGTIAAGVGAPGSEVQFADILRGDGWADYLVVNPDGSVQAWLNGGQDAAAPDGWLWTPVGTIAAGVGAPGSQIQFADLTGSGRADYLNVNPDGSVQAWLNGAVPAPAGGLGSNSNYILYSGCSPLIGLTVTITVTEDMVWQSSAPPSGSGSAPLDGFGFQLNAYSPQNETSAWQQYAIALIGTELTGAVDNWPMSGPNIINDFFGLASLPSVAIPAGYVLQISLAVDNSSNVASATYAVTDNQGNTLANTTVDLLSLAGVTSADLAPIIAFELNVVGPADGDSAVLSSGAGTITYQAGDVLAALNQEPPCAESGYITAETANSFYSQLPWAPSNTFTQSFEISTAQPMIRKQGKPRPGLIIPRP